MNHLAQAIADTYAYYVGQNDDLEGFFSDLAIMIQETEGYPADLPECLEANLQLNRALDGEEDEEA